MNASATRTPPGDEPKDPPILRRMAVPTMLLIAVLLAGVYTVVVVGWAETGAVLALALGVPLLLLLLCIFLLRQTLAVRVRARRISQINRVLMGISRVVNDTVDLEALYPAVHRLLGETIDVSNFFIALYDRPANVIRLYMNLPPSLPLTMGSPQQLGQVFMNLINNAVEAMGVSPVAVEKAIFIRAELEQDQIVVRVIDTGAGIAREDMGNLFDAFFTRKKKFGMGVGLSICHRIIEDHNGTITVDSHVSRGAEFTIRRPVGDVE